MAPGKCSPRALARGSLGSVVRRRRQSAPTEPTGGAWNCASQHAARRSPPAPARPAAPPPVPAPVRPVRWGDWPHGGRLRSAAPPRYAARRGPRLAGRGRGRVAAGVAGHLALGRAQSAPSAGSAAGRVRPGLSAGARGRAGGRRCRGQGAGRGLAGSAGAGRGPRPLPPETPGASRAPPASALQTGRRAVPRRARPNFGACDSRTLFPRSRARGNFCAAKCRAGASAETLRPRLPGRGRPGSRRGLRSEVPAPHERVGGFPGGVPPAWGALGREMCGRRAPRPPGRLRALWVSGPFRPCSSTRSTAGGDP